MVSSILLSILADGLLRAGLDLRDDREAIAGGSPGEDRAVSPLLLPIRKEATLRMCIADCWFLCLLGGKRFRLPASRAQSPLAFSLRRDSSDDGSESIQPSGPCAFRATTFPALKRGERVWQGEGAGGPEQTVRFAGPALTPSTSTAPPSRHSRSIEAEKVRVKPRVRWPSKMNSGFCRSGWRDRVVVGHQKVMVGIASRVARCGSAIPLADRVDDQHPQPQRRRFAPISTERSSCTCRRKDLGDRFTAKPGGCAGWSRLEGQHTVNAVAEAELRIAKAADALGHCVLGNTAGGDDQKVEPWSFEPQRLDELEDAEIGVESFFSTVPSWRRRCCGAGATAATLSSSGRGP